MIDSFGVRNAFTIWAYNRIASLRRMTAEGRPEPWAVDLVRATIDASRRTDVLSSTAAEKKRLNTMLVAGVDDPHVRAEVAAIRLSRVRSEPVGPRIQVKQLLRLDEAQRNVMESIVHATEPTRIAALTFMARHENPDVIEIGGQRLAAGESLTVNNPWQAIFGRSLLGAQHVEVVAYL